jgi:hypothetical protein
VISFDPTSAVRRTIRDRERSSDTRRVSEASQDRPGSTNATVASDASLKPSVGLYGRAKTIARASRGDSPGDTCKASNPRFMPLHCNGLRTRRSLRRSSRRSAVAYLEPRPETRAETREASIRFPRISSMSGFNLSPASNYARPAAL